MSNWSRRHDAWIAEKCEGIKVAVVGVNYYQMMRLGGWHGLVAIPHYLTDQAACIRAAEAWRKKDPKHRSWEVDSPYFDGDDFEAIACDMNPAFTTRAEEEDPTFSAALAQSLLLATGWTEPAGGGGE
jgi:hypothetical protein